MKGSERVYVTPIMLGLRANRAQYKRMELNLPLKKSICLTQAFRSHFLLKEDRKKLPQFTISNLIQKVFPYQLLLPIPQLKHLKENVPINHPQFYPASASSSLETRGAQCQGDLSERDTSRAKEAGYENIYIKRGINQQDMSLMRYGWHHPFCRLADTDELFLGTHEGLFTHSDSLYGHRATRNAHIRTDRETMASHINKRSTRLDLWFSLTEQQSEIDLSPSGDIKRDYYTPLNLKKPICY
ncbi:hypothetical protein Tco_0410344 [Tanacetum coccineum]